METSRSTTRRYSAADRARAVELADKVGPSAASRELGISSGTIAYWQHNARAGKGAAPAGAEPAAAEEAVAKVEPAAPPASPTSREAKQPARKPAAVAKVYTPSQRAEILEHAAEHGPTAASRKFHVSRFAIRDWQRRVALNAAGKSATSPVTGPDERPESQRDEKILEIWKTHPGLGPSQIRNQLRRQGLKVSTHTVRCVLDANGYVPPKVRREPAHDHRYEAVRPNHLWHLDFLHRHIHKQKIYVLLILDDYSRFIVGGAIWDGERVAAVQEVFEEAVSRHGKPEKAMSDGGSAFYAWRGIGEFTRLLDEMEVDQLIAKIPQVNGKLEVLNANIQKELFNQETFFDLGQAQQRLKAWISFYNFRRTHHALGGLLVPADRYFGRDQEVMAQIEAGRSPDGLGEPIPVGERQLDFFRVTSHAGQVEVYLMGQRLAFPIPR